MPLIYSMLSCNVFSEMSNQRKNLIINTLRLFLCIKDRIIFLQLKRFRSFCLQYFRIKFRKEFDFLAFNKILLDKHLSSTLAIALDPNYISKSGKLTYGAGFSVVNILANTSCHLEAFQNPSSKDLIERTCWISAESSHKF